MTASLQDGTASRKTDPALERAPGPTSGPTPGWDPVVRLTHWGIATAVVVNGLITAEGSASHVWIGYGAVALLLTRLLWGGIGTEAARFSSFPPSPRRALGAIGDFMLGQGRVYRSHNPVGALMAYALWGCLAAVSLSGIAMTGAPFGGGVDGILDGGSILGYAGTLEGHGRHDREEGILSEFHEGAAALLFWLAALHVIAVVAHGRFGDGGLIRSMVTGADRRPSDPA